MVELPVAPVERLLKKAGAQRISFNAKRELALTLERKGLLIAAEAIRYARHAGRRTVKSKDIQSAMKLKYI